MFVVEIGQWECFDEENEDSDFRPHCLLLFLYSIYSNFSLESNSLESFVGPLDEQRVLYLALTKIKRKTELFPEELSLLWIEICKERLFTPRNNHCELVQAVENVLTTCNVIDRIHLLKAIKAEYEINSQLMETLHSTEYLVVTSHLSWFESLVVSLLVEIGVSHLRFIDTPDLKPFHSLQLCSTSSERYTEIGPIFRALLAYLAVGVNIRNTIDLAFIINKPFRGFSQCFFATLRHVAESSSILPGQLVLSYPACMTESAATSTLSEENAKLLRPFSLGLAHLADTIRSCQDALSGYLSDDSSLAVSNQFGCMSTQSAASAVCDCLTAAVKAFSKPLKISGASFGSIWSLETVRECEGRLRKELELLMASTLVSGTESLLTSTPNRPTHAGGSIQGRAAFRLARLFLVFEAAGQVVAPLHDPSWGPLKTPLGQRTFSAFFRSPSSAETTPRPATSSKKPKAKADDATSCTNKLVSALKEHSGADRSRLPELALAKKPRILFGNDYKEGEESGFSGNVFHPSISLVHHYWLTEPATMRVDLRTETL
ncbi:unnamed protein product [Hydatigera taeniaeformis]|uniref:Non-specific serine/threonine protein kinase n=1 Tax=Hydatigena taeniaeformis TaxID=6205 RepID=A0A0R3X668_HYDTA|nr:unnamed protein product [Hydatigera taeniaeformis]